MSTTRLLAMMDSVISMGGVEKQATIMRNNALDSMQKYDVASVAVQYLENESLGADRTLEAVMVTSIAVLAMVEAVMSGQAAYALITFAATIIAPPLAASAMKLNDTTKWCEAWLEEKLGRDDLEHIKNTPLDAEGLFHLKNMMLRKEINTDSIERKRLTYQF